MVTLDQVLLLQKKVETAVAKIRDLTAKVQQLNSDNDALRSKCAELTKALTDKSELVTSLENEQDKIESSIINALKELDIVEDSILGNASVEAETKETAVSEESADDEEEEKVIDYTSSSERTSNELPGLTAEGSPAPAENTVSENSNEAGSLFERADEINSASTSEVSAGENNSGNQELEIF